MKNITYLIAAFLFSFGALQAQVYLGSDFLYELNESEPGVSAKIGYSFQAGNAYSSDATHNIEVEGVFTSTEDRVFGINIEGDFSFFMLNYKYTSNFLSDDVLAYFYIGGGAGVAIVDVDINGFASDDDTSFACQGFLGLGYQLTDNASVELGYRIIRAESVKLFGVESDDFDLDMLQAGLTLRF